MFFESIAIASDHRGFWLKKDLIEHYANLGIYMTDYGTTNDCVSVDYPVYARQVVDHIKTNQNSCGILICYSGIGMSIAANRTTGIRAALCGSEELARLSREHNDANILCIGSGFMNFEAALKCCDVFINTSLADERHLRRIKMLDES